MHRFGLNEGHVAFVVTVTAAFASALVVSSDPPRGERLVALTLGALAYVGFGVAEERLVQRAQRAGSTWGAWGASAYFVGQAALGLALIVVGRADGFLTLLLFPLVGQAVARFSGRAALLVSGAILLAYVAALSLMASVPIALRAGLTVVAGFVFVAFVTRAGMAERRGREEVERLNTALQEANERLRAYAAQAEEFATAAERARLAREIHDGLGHYLTGVNMQIEAARALLTADAPVPPPGVHANGTTGAGENWERGLAGLERAQGLAREALQEVRRSVAAFRTDPLTERPLPEAVARLVEDARAEGLEVTLEVVGTPRALPAPASLTLFRAAQEGLTNARKHARASRVAVVLDFSASGVAGLRVEDDGVGIGAAGNGEATAAGGMDVPGGFGLLGLRERAQLVGGVAAVERGGAGGTRLRVEVPG